MNDLSIHGEFIPLTDALHELCGGDACDAIIVDRILYLQKCFKESDKLADDGTFYRTRERLVRDCKGWVSSGAMSRRIKKMNERYDWFVTYRDDDPNKARRYKIDVELARKSLTETRLPHTGEASPSKVDVHNGPPTPSKVDANRDLKEKERLSNNQARTHENQPTNQPTDDPPQSLDAYILHVAAQLDYQVSPSMAGAVAVRVAGSGLTDDDERRYILDSMASRAANDKPPGKWAHYCGQKSDVEQWQGDSGNETGNAGMDLFNRLD